MSEQGPGDGGPQEIGSVAEEATKLFGAVAEWARDQGSDLGSGVAALVDQASASVQEINAHIATDDPECRYCPICRTVHTVREASPEVRAQLATAASSFLQAAAGLVASAAGASGSPVEHIDLDDDVSPQSTVSNETEGQTTGPVDDFGDFDEADDTLGPDSDGGGPA